jgi:hypothetical protein
MNCQPSLQQRLVDPPNAVALERKAEVDARAQGLQKALPKVLSLLQSVPDEVARMALELVDRLAAPRPGAAARKRRDPGILPLYAYEGSPTQVYRKDN